MVLAVWIAACAAPTAPDRAAGTREIVRAREQLHDYLAECTARHGYDPESASGLGPYSLGAGEREWRECVYQGIEKFLIPKTLSPDAYRNAIAEDRKMTESVAGGRMTRAQRGERVQDILKEIDRIEETNRAKLQTQAVDRAVKEEMQRQLDVTRRSMIVPLGR
jgi:hypothetical protein